MAVADLGAQSRRPHRGSHPPCSCTTVDTLPGGLGTLLVRESDRAKVMVMAYPGPHADSLRTYEEPTPTCCYRGIPRDLLRSLPPFLPCTCSSSSFHLTHHPSPHIFLTLAQPSLFSSQQFPAQSISLSSILRPSTTRLPILSTDS